LWQRYQSFTALGGHRHEVEIRESGSVTASVLITNHARFLVLHIQLRVIQQVIYGSIGTLIALMIWINLISLLLIFGL
jgi:uncharacterized BrkB/YihY/UPF0761 family membrane protein